MGLLKGGWPKGCRKLDAWPQTCLGLTLAFCMLSSAASNPVVADVQRYDVTGNTLLNQAQIQQALAGYTGQVPFSTIQNAAEKLQEAYRQAGYGAVVVQVPEQTIQGQVVRLQVIEGQISQLQVTGFLNFSRDNILRGLPSLALKMTPSLSQLDSELLMVNENPAKAVRVVFQPGEKTADVEALVVVEEQPVERWQASLDNTGNDATGRYRLGVSYQNANLSDSDAVLGLSFITSPTHPSQTAVVSSTLRVPLYRQKTFLEFSLLGSNTRNTPNQTPAGELRFAGEGVSVGARAIWTLPSLQELKHQASIGLESRRYLNSCTLGDLGAEGCGTAAASVNVFPMTLGYTLQKPGQFQGSLQWVSNLAIDRAGNDVDFNASRAGANSRYSLWRFNTSGSQSLTPNWALIWRADGQLSNDALVSAEQHGLGGPNSVRAYPLRSLAGDSGLTASAEIRTSLLGPANAEQPQSLYGSLFIDGGTVSNQLNTFCTSGRTSCSLWSAGVGLSWRPAKNTSARFDLGRAGETINDTRAGDWRLQFSLIQVL